jgi:quercetin dioxygenase-like cupin family protein
MSDTPRFNSQSVRKQKGSAQGILEKLAEACGDADDRAPLTSRPNRERLWMPDYQVKNVEPVAVGTDIQVRVFTLADGDVIPWHYHSESTDHYFVLRGKLTIETRSPDHRHQLSVGERHKILPGVPHRISNESTSECQFLLVQGVGQYDWHEAHLIKNEGPRSY